MEESDVSLVDEDLEVVASDLAAELKEIGADFKRFVAGAQSEVSFEYGDAPQAHVMVSLLRYSDAQGFFNFTIDAPGRGNGCICARFNLETGELCSTQRNGQPVPPRMVAQAVLNLTREFKVRK